MVKKGDVLAQIDPRPYEISLDNAQGTLATRPGAAADRPPRPEALPDAARAGLDRQASRWTRRRRSCKQYEGTVKSDKANIDTFKLDLVYARITAPVSGRVGLRQVDPGNYVTPSDTNGLVVITQLQPISVIFTTSEDNLAAIIQQTAVRARSCRSRRTTAATPRRSKAACSKHVDNQIDTTTGTVKLRAIFQNSKSHAVPESVREHATAGRYDQGRRDRADIGRAQRLDGPVRLRREAGQHRDRAARSRSAPWMASAPASSPA